MADITRRECIGGGALGLGVLAGMGALGARQALADTADDQLGDELAAFVSNPDIYRQANNNAEGDGINDFVDDESAQPTDEELESMVKVALLAPSGGNSCPEYFTIVRDYDAQLALAPDYVSHGTVTVLVSAFPELKKRLASIQDGESPFGTDLTDLRHFAYGSLNDLGIATGYLIMMAMAYGYSTHVYSVHTLQSCENITDYMQGTYTPPANAGKVDDATSQIDVATEFSYWNAVTIGRRVEVPAGTEGEDLLATGSQGIRPDNYCFYDPSKNQ